MFGFDHSPPQRHFLVPQVVQSSMMDCGPAALKSILGGFGINVNYGRLREACQTDVDGTSIDTLEDMASRLGLAAEQIMLPADHLLLPDAETLPALVVVRQPNGLTHFIVIWRLHGRWVQIMDPASGRHWIRKQALLDRLYIHQQTVTTRDWFEWAATPGFYDLLHQRLLAICDDPEWATHLLKIALARRRWYPLAALDAATRMTTALIRASGIKPGAEAGELVNQFCLHPKDIPEIYWSVQPLEDDEDTLVFQGAVLIQMLGVYNPEATLEEENSEGEPVLSARSQTSNELTAALQEQEPAVTRQIFQALREDGLLTPGLLLAGLLLAALGSTLEVLLLRGVVEIGQQIHLVSQQMEVFSLLLLFMFSLLLLEWPIALSATRLGRKLEIRLRQRLLEKLPRLEDRYFHSRLTSDMIQRAYELRQLRQLPLLGLNFLRQCFQLLFVSVGLIILYPPGAGLVLLCSVLIMALSLFTQPLLYEKDLRFRTHISSLSRFYLDALLGLIPIRSHRAAAAVSLEHERLVIDWAEAGSDFFLSYERAVLASLLLSTGLSVLLVFNYVSDSSDSSGTLILLYWMLMLPQLGQMLTETAQQYPAMRSRLLRVLEPLSAADESLHWYPDDLPCPEHIQPPDLPALQGVQLDFHQVMLTLSAQTVLHTFTARIAAGEHLAIVGPSGAGKSSLVGLLLGWHHPAKGGSIRVDGELIHNERLHQLRRELVWVDPEVQLWNRSLLSNLQYGNKTDDSWLSALKQADLWSVLQNLPQGEQTRLGEGGGLLSGGEGQRVRLARAFNRDKVRLVILDEPFRGLSREQRQALLHQARAYWRNATLIFISHDVSDTQQFDRVWVIIDGKVVEDDSPAVLMQQGRSQYARLLGTEKTVREVIWNSAQWRRLWLENGRLIDSHKNTEDTE